MMTDHARVSLTPTPSFSAARIIQCGRYELVAKVGHGGMADVFLGVAGGTGGFRKLLVVKRMHPELLEEEQFRDMFLDEARLAARLNHPNVVQTQEVDTSSDGVPYIAMEYLEGQSLDKIVRESMRAEKPLTLKLTIPIITGVLDALHYAHTVTDFDGTPLNVVHRDISPGNIFVTYEGAPKLLDFGIAKAATQVAETRTGNIKGKLSYMAPEQARSENLDGRADIWSTGVVFWECLAKRRLFRDSSDLETIRRVLAGDVPPLDDLDDDVPLELVDIVDKALTVDRSERWEDAAAMRDALTDWCRKTNFHVADKTELSAYMKDLFEDRISLQKERIRIALHAFDARESESQDRTLPDLDGHSPTGSYMAPPPVSSSKLVLVLVALLLVTGGALAGVFANQRREDPRPEPIAPAAAMEQPAPIGGQPARQGESTENDRVEEVEREPVGAEEEPTDGTETDGAETDGAETDGAETDGDPRPRIRRPRVTMTERVVDDAVAESTMESVMESAMMAPAGETGRLSIVTTPWSNVYLDGRRIGQTPLIGVELPAGRHVLDLRNPEENIQTRYPVTIGANGHERVRISLR